MSLTDRFRAQRGAFEKALEDGSWTEFERFLSPHIRYEVLNMPFHCVIEGRETVVAGMRRSIERFDRLCHRELGGARWVLEEGNNVLVQGAVSYRRGDSPPLEARLWEIASYENGSIVRLIDLYEPGESAKFTEWMKEWGKDLDASYV